MTKTRILTVKAERIGDFAHVMFHFDNGEKLPMYSVPVAADGDKRSEYMTHDAAMQWATNMADVAMLALTCERNGGTAL